MSRRRPAGMRRRLLITAAAALLAALPAAGSALLRASAAPEPERPAQVTLPTLPLVPTTTTVPAPPPTTAAAPAEATTSSTAATAITTVEVTTTAESTTTTTEAAATTPPVTGAPAPAAVPRPTGGPVSNDLQTPSVIQTASISGAYGVGVGAVLLFVLILIGFASHLTAGGSAMSNPQPRWRLVGGVVSLALAAVVGIVGYLRLSLEPAVNRQIPYLASAGMALVLLAAIGASLIVAEQLRADDNRLDELEAAVRQLADALAPSIEAPARRARSAARTQPAAEPGAAAGAATEAGRVADAGPVAEAGAAPPRRRRSSR